MILKFAYRALCIVLATFASVHSASALVGTVDRQNEYPYVVKLSIEFKGNHFASCSGVVHGFILSTAAHCLFDSGGLALKVTVHYVDTLGAQQTASASSKDIYVPQRYIDDDRAFHSDYKGAPHDIGYAALDKDVVVPGYLHWGLELLRDDSVGPGACNHQSECSNWWDGDIHDNKVFRDNLRKMLGSDLSNVKVRVIGYGNYKCDDYSAREEHCEVDGQRRYTELKLKPNLADPGAPWMWCTGQNADGINPVQHGDSGGPVFVQALDGRWLYVGYTSRGNNADGCASSMFNDLHLWHQVMESYTWSIRKTTEGSVFDDVNAWHLTVAHQFIDEWIRIESAPAELATYGQALLYVNLFGSFAGDDKIDFHRKRVAFPDIFAYRKVFFERWPVRKFSITDFSTNCENTDQFDYCWIRGLVSSHFEGADGTIADGQFRLSLRVDMPMFSTGAFTTLDLLPTIDDEHCDPVEGVQAPPDMGCQLPSPHWNLAGSNIRMVADGAKREFYYRAPRDDLAKMGIKPGMLLFSGSRSGYTYSGTAYVFRQRCGALPYAVSGKVSNDGEWVRLIGQAPTVDDKCRIVSTEKEWLDLYYESDK